MIQSFTWETLTLTQEIVFVNNRISLLRTRVRNTGGPKEVKIIYEGSFFTQYFQGQVIDGRTVYLEFPATKCCFEIEAGEGCHAVVWMESTVLKRRYENSGEVRNGRICLFILPILMTNQNM